MIVQNKKVSDRKALCRNKRRLFPIHPRRQLTLFGEKSFSQTTTKKPGVFKLPMMPNEFGVCMVYGR